MNINRTASTSTHVSSNRSAVRGLDAEKQFTKEINEKKTDPSTAENSPNIWAELAQKYDVTHATFDDLTEMSTLLYKSGEISLKEHAILTFDFDRGVESIQMKTVGVPINFKMHTTRADSAGNRNWIEEFQGRSDRAFNHGNLIGHHAYQGVISILQRLQA
ncbi:hypothetical protein [Amphibacillus cookii]|uniref:hypothetical protein n=1 Tax=Amphibacillus cookii TaxID=767787 RepID=UPI00195EBAC9|nr:hypothetical protein [Amphibacillus cookii]MBM7542796.1 hypothetical protein [Amphibacillus cookii]